jgi:hypothetical protein
LLKDAPLAVGQIYSIFEGFSHTFSMPHLSVKSNTCAHFVCQLKPLKRVKGFYPTAKACGRYALGS